VLHVGAGIGEAVVDGYRTNLPVREVRGEHGAEPLVTMSDPGVVVEAVKLADDGSGDVVVRLYEALGQRTRATVTAGFDCGSMAETDLLERPVTARALSGDRLDLRPFQLVTLRG
jgi:alpha-mannosidase